MDRTNEMLCTQDGTRLNMLILEGRRHISEVLYGAAGHQPLIVGAFDAGDGGVHVGMPVLVVTVEHDAGAVAIRSAVRSRRRRQRCRYRFGPAAEDAEQRVAERLAELAVEIGVDQWIQRRVEVADPEEHFDDDVGAVTRIPAQRDRQIP